MASVRAGFRKADRGSSGLVAGHSKIGCAGCTVLSRLILSSGVQMPRLFCSSQFCHIDSFASQARMASMAAIEKRNRCLHCSPGHVNRRERHPARNDSAPTLFASSLLASLGHGFSLTAVSSASARLSSYLMSNSGTCYSGKIARRHHGLFERQARRDASERQSSGAFGSCTSFG